MSSNNGIHKLAREEDVCASTSQASTRRRGFLVSSVSDPGTSPVDVASNISGSHSKRPASTICVRESRDEGFWSWDSISRGLVLRRGQERSCVSKVRTLCACHLHIAYTLFMNQTFSEPQITFSEPVIHPVHADLPPKTPILPSTPLRRYYSPYAADISTSEEPSFDISLISDTSSFSIDTSSPLATPERYLNSRHVSGLGISGLPNKSGIVFGGLGIVSIQESSPLRSGAMGIRDTLDSNTEEGISLSQTFLEEAFLTFTEDPLHLHSLTVIPECEEDEQPVENISHLPIAPPTAPPTPTSPGRTAGNEPSRRKVVLKRNLSASTVSSTLKKTTRLVRTNSKSASSKRT